jgi:hypothetical protein
VLKPMIEAHRVPAADCRLTRHFPVTNRAEADAESGAQLPADGRHTPSALPPNAPEPRFASLRFPGTPLLSFGRC